MRKAEAKRNGPLADVRSGARAVCPGLVLTRSGPRRAPSGEWRPAGRASGLAPVGGPVRRRAPVRPRPGPSGCVRPRPGPDLPSGAPSGTGLVASMLASARRRAPSGAKFPRPEVSVGRPVRRRRPDGTSGRGPSTKARPVRPRLRGAACRRLQRLLGRDRLRSVGSVRSQANEARRHAGGRTSGNGPNTNRTRTTRCPRMGAVRVPGSTRQ